MDWGTPPPEEDTFRLSTSWTNEMDSQYRARSSSVYNLGKWVSSIRAYCNSRQVNSLDFIKSLRTALRWRFPFQIVCKRANATLWNKGSRPFAGTVSNCPNWRLFSTSMDWTTTGFRFPIWDCAVCVAYCSIHQFLHPRVLRSLFRSTPRSPDSL